MIVEVLIFFLPIVLYFIYGEWAKRRAAGIPYLRYKFPYGHLEKVINREKSFGLAINEYYSGTEDGLVGLYMVYKPVILVCDPAIVKMILTTHFEHFSDRGLHTDHRTDPLSTNLFTMDLERWKPLRAKLTPAFSGSKIRQMMAPIQATAKIFQAQLHEAAKDNQVAEIKMKDMSSRFVVDIIASTIFGIEVDSLSEEDHPFRGLGKRLSRSRNSSLLEAVRFACVFLWPRVCRFFGLGVNPRFVTEFVLDLVTKTFAAREANPGVVRRDVMQQLLQLRNTGSVDNDSWSSRSADGINETPFLTIEECASNAFLFYVAGSESSSSTICFCLFELSRQPRHVKTLQEEIDRILLAHGGEITYEALREMRFLDKCVLETIRKYPALPMLNRRCTKEFKVPGSQQIIYRGQTVLIPLRAIQTDSRHFPHPLTFNPNRCDPEDPDYSPVPYYAFGDGPKSCIAYRLGSTMVKVGLVSLLSRFNLKEPTDSGELDFSIGDLGMLPKEDFTVRLEARADKVDK